MNCNNHLKEGASVGKSSCSRHKTRKYCLIYLYVDVNPTLAKADYHFVCLCFVVSFSQSVSSLESAYLHCHPCCLCHPGFCLCGIWAVFSLVFSESYSVPHSPDE